MTQSSVFPRMHVSLYVQDVDRTVNFYEKFFNLKANKVKDDYAKFVLDAPSLIISFVQKPDKVQPRFGHLGFQVSSVAEMESTLERAKGLGIETREEMGTRCCYALQDKFWVSDPDGHQWEVYYFHDDASFNDPHYAITEESRKSEPVGVCAPGAGCC